MAPNRFDRMEWAEAFGDLEALTPFVVGVTSAYAVRRGWLRL